MTGPDLAFYMGGSVDDGASGVGRPRPAELITLTRRPRHSYLVTLPDERTLQAWLEEQARQGGAGADASGPDDGTRRVGRTEAPRRTPDDPFEVPREDDELRLDEECPDDCQCAECFEEWFLSERRARDA